MHKLNIIGLILFLNLIFGCKNNLNNSNEYSNIEGIWGKDGVYLNFSNNLWNFLIAISNAHFYFNGDEDYAYPDGFDSYNDYINAGINPVYCFEGNSGYFDINANYITLYDDETKYIMKYKINNDKLTVVSSNSLKISYDNSVYRPFNPDIRSSYNGNASFYLNGIWNNIK
jgi:hypothetical protein